MIKNYIEIIIVIILIIIILTIIGIYVYINYQNRMTCVDEGYKGSLKLLNHIE